jgi:eukaryotic-like serine/threonine-protein kinase
MTSHGDLQARLGGRYEIERELGRGGMGAVYLARDVKLGRSVALKVLPADFATATALRDRFLRETRMAASFSHPNIVPVYAVEESDDLLAYVMGYIEGESVAERVRRAGPLTVREVVRLLQDVGYALAYAHGRAIVHRDIKPDNIMIERATSRALVMDFGVSRTITAPDDGANAGGGLTRVGEVVGTAEYMSPEQATGDRVDGRSDLYSLGLTAYYALTGRVAMAADSTGKALVKQITETLAPMATVRPDLPSALAGAIDRCLMKDPDARFARAEELVEALDAAQLTGPDVPVPIRLFAQEAGTLSLVLVMGTILAYFMARAVSAANGGSADMLLPVLLLAGVLFTRIAQTFGEARRLAVNGFSADAVHRGLVAVLAERKAQRDALRADPAARRARRRSLGILAVAPVVGFGMAWLAFTMRKQIGPRAYQVPITGLLLIFGAVALFGMLLGLLLRSPFRMPVGERLFRVVWLGPIGRTFFRAAGRGVARPRSASGVSVADVSRSTNRPTPAAAKPAARAPDRIDALEMRVAELERWRQGS